MCKGLTYVEILQILLCIAVYWDEMKNVEPTHLVRCLYKMLPLYQKRKSSSLAPPKCYVAKSVN